LIINHDETKPAGLAKRYRMKVEMAHQFFSYLLCTSMDNRQQSKSRDQYERTLSRLKNRDNLHAAIQVHTQSRGMQQTLVLCQLSHSQ